MFFFTDAPTTEIYTLSLHDALPIYALDLVREPENPHDANAVRVEWRGRKLGYVPRRDNRSEEHTSELQSQFHLVCRLLLEKKKDDMFHNFVQRSDHWHREDLCSMFA